MQRRFTAFQYAHSTDLHRQLVFPQDFSGDVKKHKGSKNEYRLRVGDHRVLFELVGRGSQNP